MTSQSSKSFDHYARLSLLVLSASAYMGILIASIAA